MCYVNKIDFDIDIDEWGGVNWKKMITVSLSITVLQHLNQDLVTLVWLFVYAANTARQS